MGKRVKAKSKQEQLRGILALCALAATVIAVGVVLARYVFGQEGQAIVAAREFYFSSDLLKEEGAEYTLSPVSQTVRFEVRNYADELRITNDPIAYSVTLEDGAQEGALEDETGILTGGTATAETVTLTLDGPGRYTVTAVTNTGAGEKGYQAELSATFIVPEAPAGVYKHLQDQGAFYLLTVWAEYVKGDAKIIFPAALIPDNTDPAMADAVNDLGGDTSTFTDGDDSFSDYYASHAYRFFKSGSETYTAANFTVTVDGTTAEEGTP